MEIKLEFDSKNLNDVRIAGGIGIALSAVAEAMTREEVDTPGAETVPEQAQPAESHDGTSQPSESHAEDPVPEEKPKRTRRSKKTEDTQSAQDAPVEAQPAPDAVSEGSSAPDELPFDAELKEEPKPAEPAIAESKPEVPSFPKMTKDEFTAINKAKRAELGLTMDGEHSDLISTFNSYCQRMSQMFYGNPKPSTLPPEELYQYADWFKTIKLNPDYIPGAADEEHGNPFVSSVHSNQ